MDRIDRFEDEFGFLSNFWLSPVRLPDSEYPDVYRTIEHAYQACKTLDPKKRRLIREAETPGEARRMGREVALRPAWDEIKLNVMRDLLWQKFSENVRLRAQLLATGDVELVEGNMWGDTFWGVDLKTGKGENHLGNLLMETREKIREQTAAVLFAKRVSPELDLFEDMLKRAKISYERELSNGGILISIEAGYPGFVSEVRFGKNGELMSIEAYE